MGRCDAHPGVDSREEAVLRGLLRIPRARRPAPGARASGGATAHNARQPRRPVSFCPHRNAERGPGPAAVARAARAAVRARGGVSPKVASRS